MKLNTDSRPIDGYEGPLHPPSAEKLTLAYHKVKPTAQMLQDIGTDMRHHHVFHTMDRPKGKARGWTHVMRFDYDSFGAEVMVVFPGADSMTSVAVYVQGNVPAYYQEELVSRIFQLLEAQSWGETVERSKRRDLLTRFADWFFERAAGDR